MAAIKIESPIVDFKVKKPEDEQAPAAPEPAPVPDDNPLLKRIDSRPDGSLEAVSEKVVYYTQEGKKQVYILVSFLEVDGVMGGEPMTIERPIEFFFPVGQLSSEHQWISATMRNLSLAARGGFAAQALQDLRKVAWDKGPVRCGTNEWGKPLYHDSEVAAIVWAIQQMLYRRGFLDVDGNQVPVEVLNRKRRGQRVPLEEAEPEVDATPAEPVAVEAVAVTPGAANEPSATTNSKGRDCGCGLGGEMVLMDGCETCISCGLSKC